MIGNIRRALALLDRRHRLLWLGIVGLAVAASVLESAGVVLVFGLIKVMTDPKAAESLPVIRQVHAFLSPIEPSYFLFVCAGGTAFYFLLKNILIGAFVFARQTVYHFTSAWLAQTLFRRYIAAPYEIHLSRSRAEIQRNVLGSTDSVARGVLEPVMTIVSEVFVAAGIVAVLFVTEPVVTVIVLAFLGAIGTIVLLISHRYFVAWGQKTAEFQKNLLRIVLQTAGVMKEVVIAGAGAFFERRFAHYKYSVARIDRAKAVAAEVPRMATEVLMVFGILVAVVIVSMQDRAGEIVAVLGLFGFAGFRLVPSANRIAQQINFVHYWLPSLDIVEREFAEISRPTAEPAPHDGGGRLPFRDRLEFRDVSYKYPAAERPSLNRISLTVRAGESIGLVGLSGAGKSTLVDVIIGVFHPQQGTITVDGNDIFAHLPEWRRLIGYVPQRIYILDDTLRRNVAMGIEDAEIDEGRVREAIAIAGLESVAAELPQGLDTMLGDQGIRFSGGQSQRVGIARALYRQPALLVLDEATASLDSETEYNITQAINRLHGEKTLIVIAHRLSTVRACDRLILMEGGRVADTGTFAELSARNPNFARMVELSTLKAPQELPEPQQPESSHAPD